MDLPAIAFFALVVSVVVLKTRADARWRARSGYKFQRVFSVGAVGLLYFVSGLIGWDLSYIRGWFQGTKWVEGPIWWQVGLGLAGLLLAGYWARHASRPARL